MLDYDSNYSSISCPFCNENISKNISPKGEWVDDLEDEEDNFFQCQKCDEFFKAELNIQKEYNYIISKPTKAEIKKYELINNNTKNIIKDYPGQTFMW